MVNNKLIKSASRILDQVSCDRIGNIAFKDKIHRDYFIVNVNKKSCNTHNTASLNIGESNGK